MHVDYLNSQIGKCPEGCEGMDAEDDESLCPTCCDTFAMVMAEEDRLAGDKEYNEVMRKLKEACDQDKTGRLERILKQSREGKVVH